MASKMAHPHLPHPDLGYHVTSECTVPGSTHCPRFLPFIDDARALFNAEDNHVQTSILDIVAATEEHHSRLRRRANRPPPRALPLRTTRRFLTTSTFPRCGLDQVEGESWLRGILRQESPPTALENLLRRAKTRRRLPDQIRKDSIVPTTRKAGPDRKCLVCARHRCFTSPPWPPENDRTPRGEGGIDARHTGANGFASMASRPAARGATLDGPPLPGIQRCTPRTKWAVRKRPRCCRKRNHPRVTGGNAPQPGA